MKNIRGWATFAAVVVVFIIIVVLTGGGTGAEKVSQGKLYQEILAGNIEAIQINGDFQILALKKDSEIDIKDFPGKADYSVKIASRVSFEKFYQEQVISVFGENSPDIIYDDPGEGAWLAQMLPILIAFGLAGIIIFVMFRMSQGSNNKAMNFGRTKARVIDNVKVRFNDVAGAEEEKEELREIVEFLKNPRKFTAVGARIPKGVLLVGPPGTGKTLFAKAVAGEAGVPFFSISGSDFVEMFVGVGASRVRDLFDQAKRNMPCIIFIDEIDAVGRQRGTGLGGGHDEREQTLNQLLVQMDGFATNEGIIIMAATNRADILDPALLRPGRFDRQIFVHMPDVRGREAIIKVHSRNKPLAGDINFKVLARMTSGFSGADIENLLNEAAILAARENRTRIMMKDILEGINKVIGGPRKTSRLVTETDRRVIAYHEAGHAIVAKSLKNCDNVQEVSIIPRGMAGGWTLSRPDNDDNLKTRGYFNDELAMIMGGRAAEEIVIQDITTGASNDIKQASGIARRMVTEWGMSDKIGMLYLGGNQEVFIGRDYQAQHTYSEDMAGAIDDEIKRILDKSYATALEILKSKRAVLDNMVKVLFEKETIYTDEVTALMEGASAEEVIALVDKRIESEEKTTERENAPVNTAPAAIEKNPGEKPAAKSAEKKPAPKKSAVKKPAVKKDKE